MVEAWSKKIAELVLRTYEPDVAGPERVGKVIDLADEIQRLTDIDGLTEQMLKVIGAYPERTLFDAQLANGARVKLTIRNDTALDRDGAERVLGMVGLALAGYAAEGQPAPPAEGATP